MYFYPNIKHYRIINGYNQEYIANLLSIKQEQYCRYENGKVEIPIHLIKILSSFYNVSIDILVE